MNAKTGAQRGKRILAATWFPGAKFHAATLSNFGQAAVDVYLLFVPAPALPANSLPLGDRSIAAVQKVPAGALGYIDYGASGRPTPDGFYIAIVSGSLSDLDTLETVGVTFAESDMNMVDVTYS